MGTTTLVDLVTTRPLAFREMSVRVTTSSFLKGMFWRISTETRLAVFLDLVVLRPCETTMGQDDGSICEGWGGTNRRREKRGGTRMAVIIREQRE